MTALTRRETLNRAETILRELPYPISREAAARELFGITVLYADGESDSGAVVADTGSDSFDSIDEQETELYEYLPVEAVGEPGQSEGEG